MPEPTRSPRCRVVVIWIDWYPYHVARFRGLEADPRLHGGVVGLELVGGVGVHKGLKFREALPSDLRVQTLLPQASWLEANKVHVARLLWRKLNDLQPEVVLVPGYYTLPAIAAAVWAKVHRRTSVMMTESTAGDHRRTWWKEAPKRLAVRALFDWAVTGGKAHVDYLRQLGFPGDRIVGGYDVVDNEMFASGVKDFRKTRPSSSGPPTFLYVGRLAEEKNVAGLIAGWAAYRRDGGDWPLVLCGDGPERKALEHLAASTGFGDEVRFTGLKTSGELSPLYAEAGCFVLPSNREPWGLVVNEAMAAGLPVLVSNRCGCAPDLVHEGRNGYTFHPGDRGELQQRLQQVASLPRVEREAMGTSSATIIQSYTPAGFGAAIATVCAAQAAGRGVSLRPREEAL